MERVGDPDGEQHFGGGRTGRRLSGAGLEAIEPAADVEREPLRDGIRDPARLLGT